MMANIYNLPMVYLEDYSAIEEVGAVLLITSSPAWEAVQHKLKLPVVQRFEVTQANVSHWESLKSSIKADPSVIYAVGGGLVADASKYLAFHLDLPLVCLPTALSVDAFITAASGIRKDGCVYYIETKPPEKLVLDMNVIAAAPPSIRAAGICDVLSIATGAWDWKFAHEKGMNPPTMPFIPWVYDNALTILDGVIDCSEAAGAGDSEGLKTLYDCLAMEVQLCNQIGHARPEEGSEHYFAYCVENSMGHGLPHGDLVGPGILIAARLQGQKTERLERALKACHIPLDSIPEPIIQQTLRELPAFVARHHLAYGIAHELSFDE
jgi:glycerol-1-phosphate dehydrogenase [NAD(P)+]